MQETPVALPGPRMPADHGLTGLGFLMMLGGLLYALLMGLMCAIFLIGAALGRGSISSEQWLLILFCLFSVVRSIYHLRAGRALVYGFVGGAVSPTRTYVIIAAAHTLFGALALSKAMPGDAWISMVAMIAAWPAVVAALALTTPAARATETQLPHPADGGFESLSVLMTVFGLMGVGLLAAVLFGVVQAGGLDEGMGVLFVGVLALLIARSLVHTRAGITGLRGMPRSLFVDRAQSYTTIGMIASVAVGAWFVLMLLVGSPSGSDFLFVLLYVGIVVWLLMAWPRLVREFVDERAGYAGASQRSADRGMTALGWLLVAGGALGVAAQLSGLFVGPGPRDANMFMAFGMNAAATESHQWIALGASGLQLWAGIELVRMTSRFRASAVVYGMVGIVTTIVINLEAFKAMDRLGPAAFTLGGRQGAIMLFVAIVMSLVLPATALVLALRRDDSQARVVQR